MDIQEIVGIMIVIVMVRIIQHLNVSVVRDLILDPIKITMEVSVLVDALLVKIMQECTMVVVHVRQVMLVVEVTAKEALCEECCGVQEERILGGGGGDNRYLFVPEIERCVWFDCTANPDACRDYSVCSDDT